MVNRPPAWFVGIPAAISALSVVGFGLALFTSGGGLLIAGVMTFWIAAGIAAVIEPQHAGRNAMIVATAIAASLVAYLVVVSSRPAPPGTSYGGPNVLPPVEQR